MKPFPTSACVSFKVPTEMFWAVVLKAVALSDAKTFELTKEIPPTAAIAMMAILKLRDFAFEAVIELNFM